MTITSGNYLTSTPLCTLRVRFPHGHICKPVSSYNAYESKEPMITTNHFVLIPNADIVNTNSNVVVITFTIYNFQFRSISRADWSYGHHVISCKMRKYWLTLDIGH